MFCYRLGRFLVTRKGNRPNPTEFSGESNLRVKNPAGSNSAPELPDRRASSEGGRLPLRGAAAPRHRCGSRPGAVRPPPGIERRRPSPRSRPVPGTATIRKRRSVRQSPKLELVPASQINCISMGSCREYSGKCMHWFFRKRTDINETCTCPSFLFFIPTVRSSSDCRWLCSSAWIVSANRVSVRSFSSFTWSSCCCTCCSCVAVSFV